MSVVLNVLAQSDLFSVNGGAGTLGGTLTAGFYPANNGKFVVCASMWTGNGGVAAALTPTGGSGVTVTKRIDGPGASLNTVGLLFWEVEYATLPTSISISTGASSLFGNARVINITGYDLASFVDVLSASDNTGNSTTATATNLPDTTVANAFIIGLMTREGTAGTISVNAPFTQYSEDDESNASNQTLCIAYYEAATPGANDPSWTLTSADVWHAVAIAIKPSAGTVTPAVNKIDYASFPKEPIASLASKGLI